MSMRHANRLLGFRPTVLAAAISLAPAIGYAAEGTEALNLKDVVVTASGYEQQLIEAPASITVITKEQLEGKYYRDVTDALQGVVSENGK